MGFTSSYNLKSLHKASTKLSGMEKCYYNAAGRYLYIGLPYNCQRNITHKGCCMSVAKILLRKQK